MNAHMSILNVLTAAGKLANRWSSRLELARTNRLSYLILLLIVTASLQAATSGSGQATATFVRVDATTHGSWRTVYGGEGYSIAGDLTANPLYVVPSFSGNNFWVWNASTTDVRAVQKASNPSVRVAGTWYSPGSYFIDLNITDGAQHQLAVYCLDWDSVSRRQTIDVLDANNNVLNTQALSSNFSGGVYLVWNVTGHVKLRVSWTAGYNAVVSGLFFDKGPSVTSQTVAFVKTDTTTQGNWRTAYGSEGYNVAGDLMLNPAYVAPSITGNNFWVWNNSTPDVRAVQKASNPSDRIAGTWYSGNSYLIDLNITDTLQHQVALYCLDWDSSSRRQKIDVLDVNNNVLNTQALTSSFYGGVYLVWNVSGHVKFRVSWMAGYNAVVSGLFFGGPAVALSQVVAVGVTPSSSSLTAAKTQQLTATVTGSTNTSVNWSLSPPTGAGTITSGGLYTAPASIAASQTVMVTATSAADITKTATATITLNPTVAVSVSPVSKTLTAAQTQQFTSTVTGSSNTSVTWSLAGLGTLSATGLYTAPASVSTQQTVTVKATSVADPTVSATATVTLNPATQSSTVLLPIEVMGPAGTTQAVQVVIPSQASLGSNKIWLQIHGFDYDDKVGVQINNSQWFSLNSQTVALQGLAAGYGGIGGGFSTLKLTLNLPAGTLQYGTNTVQFRFNSTNGISSGFRILSFNFLNPDGSQMLPQTAFANDDPNAWQPPSTLASDISAGKILWQQGNLTTPASAPNLIQAHCMDCHTQDGRDLKYFNYSNYSIRSRAVFHGLTPAQGDQIASYIRSLNVPNPGRPWNPPYQPGPGLDSQPVSQWAAGAGLAAVLDTDAAMLPYVAPTQTAADFNPAGSFSIRETPIAFQLPDWNRWLPKIHPLDVWGSAFAQSTLFTTYQQLRSGLKPGDPTSYSAQKYTLANWMQYKNDFKDSVAAPNFSTSAGATQVYSTSLWQLVKLWELNQEFVLEGMLPTVTGVSAEPRGWYSNIPFQSSPSINKIPPGSPGIGNGSIATFGYFSFMWYYSQLILNNGNKQQLCTNPVDWGYFYGFVGNMTGDSPPQGMLLLAMMKKALQISNNGQGPQAGCLLGWSPSVNDPSRLITTSLANIWTGLPAATTTALMNAYVSAWYSVFQNYTPQQFYTGGYTSATETVSPGYVEGNMPSRFSVMIPHLRFFGLDPTIAGSITNWAASAWPTYNWNTVRNSTCTVNSSNIVHCTSDQ